MTSNKAINVWDLFMFQVLTHKLVLPIKDFCQQKMGGLFFFIKRTNGVWKFISAKFSPHNFFNNFSQNIFGGKYADLPISKILWTQSKCPRRLCVRQVLKKKWKCETGLVQRASSSEEKMWNWLITCGYSTGFKFQVSLSPLCALSSRKRKSANSTWNYIVQYLY